jgi:hypothetical protein
VVAAVARREETIGLVAGYETGRPVGQLQVRLPGWRRFHGYDVDELAVR